MAASRKACASQTLASDSIRAALLNCNLVHPGTAGCALQPLLLWRPTLRSTVRWPAGIWLACTEIVAKRMGFNRHHDAGDSLLLLFVI